MKLNRTAGALAAAACALTLMGCKPPPQPPPPTITVTVSHPQAAVVTNWDEFPGHLEAVETVEVRPRMAGYIESIHFEDGAEVKAGDLLFVIDPRPYQAEFERAQAQRQEAESRLDLARKDLKRADSLRGTKAISDEEYDSRSKAVREAESALAAAAANETMARLNLDYTHIKAPIGGRIGRRLVTPGNFVQLQGSGGAAPVLTTIVRLDPVYCYFDADEQAFLQYLKQGAATQGLPCEVGLVTEAGFPHRGKLDFFDNKVDARTGTIRIRAVFANADRALIPGLFARVRVPAGPPAAALLVPDVAIGSDQGRKFVFVANRDNVLEPRAITAGRQHGALRATLAGLTPEDRVVIDGLMFARPGAKVVLKEAATPPVAAAPMETKANAAPGAAARN